MSGPLGEVDFEVGGKKYTMKLGSYALALLQRNTKVPTMQFIQRPAEAWGADDVLQLFVAGLYRHKLTEEQVGEVMDDLGQDRVADLLKKSLAASFGEAGGNAAANPPIKPAGSGTGNES
jgi:hypothetical protein